MLSLKAPLEEYEEIVGEADIVQIFDMTGTKKNNASLVAGCVVSAVPSKQRKSLEFHADGVDTKKMPCSAVHLFVDTG